MKVIKEEWTNADALDLQQDSISRQEAIDALNKQFWRSLNIPICKEIRNAANETIKELPPAQPEQKKGEWVEEKINSYTSRTYCSECRNSAPFICVSGDYYGGNMHGEVKKTKFCPCCGAYMREEEITDAVN